jgi:hypothetical protein
MEQVGNLLSKYNIYFPKSLDDLHKQDNTTKYLVYGAAGK